MKDVNSYNEFKEMLVFNIHYITCGQGEILLNFGGDKNINLALYRMGLSHYVTNLLVLVFHR